MTVTSVLSGKIGREREAQGIRDPVCDETDLALAKFILKTTFRNPDAQYVQDGHEIVAYNNKTGNTKISLAVDEH